MKEFVQSIRENIPPLTGIDGRIPVVIGTAAEKSSLKYEAVELATTWPGAWQQRPGWTTRKRRKG
jgi:hypothetical protein